MPLSNQKLKMVKRFTSVLIVLIFIPTLLFAQEDLLVKIPQSSNQHLQFLQAHHGIKLRYRTPDFAIIQVPLTSGSIEASPSVLTELPDPQVLDTVTPGFNYYILWLPSAEARAAIEAYGEILHQFGGFSLLKLHANLESVLLDLPVHQRAKLPANIVLPEFQLPSFAPSISASPQQQSVIQGLLDQADGFRWLWQTITLVENEDLRKPGQFFRSRYALRVRDAVQLDDKPEPDHACDNSADYIAQQFRSYGLKVEFDPFDHRRRSALGTLVGEYVMRNVVATLPGKGPNKDRIYLMVGHYDSIASKNPGWDGGWRRMAAPGASDNASGIAEMLETARILSQQDFDFTIRFIAFSGEELFLFGSKHYTQLVRERGDDIAGVINFDLLGHDPDGNLDIHVLGDEGSQWLVNAFGAAAERYRLPIDLRLKNDPSFIFSDHSPFWDIGIPAVMVAEESSLDAPDESTEYIHSQEDDLTKISIPLLGELAIKLAVATLAELARPIVGSGGPLNPDIFWESEGITVSNPSPTKGDEVIITAEVTNAGPIPVENITVQFVVVRPDGSSETLPEQSVDLSVNQPQTVTARFTPATWGVFTLRALVNDDTRVFESNFNNNRIETELTVADPRVTIENIVAYPNPLRLNQPNAALKLTYTLSRDAEVIVSIYDTVGEQVLESVFLAGDNGGRLGANDAFTWEGRRNFFELVTPGIYICRITATDADGESRTEGTKIAVIR